MELAQRSHNRPFLLSFQINFPNFFDLLCWPVLFFRMLKSSSVWLRHWASMSFSCWGFSQWKAPGIAKRGEMPKYCPLLLLFSCSVMINSLWPHGLQHARLPCPLPSPGACSNSCPLSQWCHRTILFLYRSLLLLPSIFPSSRIFSNESALCIRWQKYWSFSISPSNEYSGLISFYDWLIWPPFSPRDYQESSPTPQFKRINSSALNLL